MKHMAKMGKIPIKKWVFRGKKWVIGLGKLRVGNHSRKAKWCKTQGSFLKVDKFQGVKW